MKMVIFIIIAIILVTFVYVTFYSDFGCDKTSNNLNIDNTQNEIIEDYDGNKYHTVKIGNQVWMTENLKSTHYNNGTPIKGVSVYDNDENIIEKYGRLYQWDAIVNSSRFI